jgi:hypothetical protein
MKKNITKYSFYKETINRCYNKPITIALTTHTIGQETTCVEQRRGTCGEAGGADYYSWAITNVQCGSEIILSATCSHL